MTSKHSLPEPRGRHLFKKYKKTKPLVNESDFKIEKAFRKLFLASKPYQHGLQRGALPLYTHSTDSAYASATPVGWDDQAHTMESYRLSVSKLAQITNQIKKDKPFEFFTSIKPDGKEVTRPIDRLSTHRVLAALRNMCVLIYHMSGFANALFDADSNPHYVLTGRIRKRKSRVPLNKLLVKYNNDILRNKLDALDVENHDSDYSQQLISEHKIDRSIVIKYDNFLLNLKYGYEKLDRYSGGTKEKLEAELKAFEDDCRDRFCESPTEETADDLLQLKYPELPRLTKSVKAPSSQTGFDAVVRRMLIRICQLLHTPFNTEQDYQQKANQLVISLDENYGIDGREYNMLYQGL